MEQQMTRDLNCAQKNGRPEGNISGLFCNQKGHVAQIAVGEHKIVNAYFYVVKYTFKSC